MLWYPGAFCPDYVRLPGLEDKDDALQKKTLELQYKLSKLHNAEIPASLLIRKSLFLGPDYVRLTPSGENARTAVQIAEMQGFLLTECPSRNVTGRYDYVILDFGTKPIRRSLWRR